MQVYIYSVQPDGTDDGTAGLVLYHVNPDIKEIGSMPVQMIGSTELTMTHIEEAPPV